MLYKKFQILTQIVGCVTIALLAIYGLLTILSGDSPVWAAIGQSQAATLASQEIPNTFNYQGFLREPDGSLTSGSYTITAHIYDLATGGTALYTTIVTNVTVQDGLFNIVLGDDPLMSNDVFAAAPRYIGISLNNDPELIPRQRLHAVPWAMTATTLVPNAEVNGLVSTGDIIAEANITTENLEVTGQSNLGPHFITPVKVGSGNTGPATGTFNAAPYISANATAVILDAKANMNDPNDPDSPSDIYIRALGDTQWYILLRGLAADLGDWVAWANQGIFPVSNNGEFEYKVTAPGFNHGWEIYLIGYFGPAE